MLSRVKGAVADAAETLRRAFAGLQVRTLSPEPFLPQAAAGPLLQAQLGPGLEAPRATLQAMPSLGGDLEPRAMDPLKAVLQAESGWASWGAGAEVVPMAPLEAGQASRVAVPPLPRAARAMGVLAPLSRPSVGRLWVPVARPNARRLDPALDAAEGMAGLEAMLALGTPIQREDIQRLPKGLWMRYSLQLVRATGENVRNLEVLGLFRVPRKGVADLRHDPKRDRLLIRLEKAGLGAPRAPFILARRKDDGAMLSCFVEDP